MSGGAATRVEFAVDGKLSSRQSPSSKVTGVRTYGAVLDTRKLKDGPHRLKVTTYGKGVSPVSTEADGDGRQRSGRDGGAAASGRDPRGQW